MAKRKRSGAQMVLVEGIEAWHMPAALARTHLARIVQYASFVDHPGDLPARRLIEEEARDALALLDASVLKWQMFWSLVYESRAMSEAQVMSALVQMKAGLDET